VRAQGKPSSGPKQGQFGRTAGKRDGIDDHLRGAAITVMVLPSVLGLPTLQMS
jgi:hypothetical protein